MVKTARKPARSAARRPVRPTTGKEPQLTRVTSSEFASRFGHWSLKAQRAPIGVVNSKTGNVVGYFLSEPEFTQYLHMRGALPRAKPIWEMSEDMLAELRKPLPDDYPE